MSANSVVALDGGIFRFQGFFGVSLGRWHACLCYVKPGSGTDTLHPRPSGTLLHRLQSEQCFAPPASSHKGVQDQQTLESSDDMLL
jgi:hypothetical protein